MLAQLAQRVMLSGDPTVTGPVIDARDFHAEAARIAQGLPAPPAPHWQSPLFPWLLSLDYRVLGVAPGNGLWLNAALAVAAAVLVHALARRALPPWPALVAGLSAALYGPLLHYASQLLGAPLDAVTALALLLGAVLTTGASGPLAHAMLGLGLGVAVASRGTVAPFGLLLAWRALSAPPLLRGGLPRVVALAAGALAGLAPVAISNRLRGGTLSLLTTNGGVNLYVGNNPDWKSTIATTPGWRWDEILQTPARHHVEDPFIASRFFVDEAVRWWASHPFRALGALAVKLNDTLSGREIPRNLDDYGALAHTPLSRALEWDRVLRFPFGLALPLAAVGAVALWRDEDSSRRHAARTIVAFVITNALGVALFFPAARYRLAIALALLPLAVAGARSLIDPALRRALPVIPAVALGVALFVTANFVGPYTQPDLRGHEDLIRGWSHLSARRFVEAQRALERSVDRDPTDAESWRALGEARDAVGDRAGALRALRRAVEIAPRYANAWQFIGSIEGVMGHPALAQEALERAVELHPSHPLAWGELSAAYLDQGRLDDAVRAGREGVRLNPTHAYFRYFLGAALCRSGERDEGEEQLTQALRLAPRNADFRRERARCRQANPR